MGVFNDVFFNAVGDDGMTGLAGGRVAEDTVQAVGVEVAGVAVRSGTGKLVEVAGLAGFAGEEVVGRR